VNECSSKTPVELTNIPTVVDGFMQGLTLNFTIEDGVYDTADDRD